MSDKRLELVTVGRAVSVFGVKGWVKIQSFTEPKENILDYAPWRLKTRHGVKSFEVDEVKVRSQDILVHFKDLDDRDAARQFLPAEIAVDKSQFDELEEGEFYWHQLVGLKVFSEFEGQQYALGRVKKLLETGANDVLVVDGKLDTQDVVSEKSVGHAESRERLIPYVPEMYIISVDVNAGEIWVNWDPEF